VSKTKVTTGLGQINSEADLLNESRRYRKSQIEFHDIPQDYYVLDSQERSRRYASELSSTE